MRSARDDVGTIEILADLARGHSGESGNPAPGGRHGLDPRSLAEGNRRDDKSADERKQPAGPAGCFNHAGIEALGRVVKLVGLEKPTDWDSQISQSVIHGEPSFLEAFHEALCTAG